MRMRFFYTTHMPHRWSSGPSVRYYDDDGEIKTLERARELARENAVDSHGDNRVVTTYGVSFDEDWKTAPETLPVSEPEPVVAPPKMCNHYRHRRIDIETQAGFGFEWYYQCQDCPTFWAHDVPIPLPYPLPGVSK